MCRRWKNRRISEDKQEMKEIVGIKQQLERMDTVSGFHHSVWWKRALYVALVCLLGRNRIIPPADRILEVKRSFRISDLEHRATWRQPGERHADKTQNVFLRNPWRWFCSSAERLSESGPNWWKPPDKGSRLDFLSGCGSVRTLLRWRTEEGEERLLPSRVLTSFPLLRPAAAERTT